MHIRLSLFRNNFIFGRYLRNWKFMNLIMVRVGSCMEHYKLALHKTWIHFFSFPSFCTLVIRAINNLANTKQFSFATCATNRKWYSQKNNFRFQRENRFRCLKRERSIFQVNYWVIMRKMFCKDAVYLKIYLVFP